MTVPRRREVAITAFGGYQVFQKQISMGVMIIFLQYCTRFIAPFENLVFMKVSFNIKDKIIIIVSHSNCFSNQVDQIYKIG